MNVSSGHDILMAQLETQGRKRDMTFCFCCCVFIFTACFAAYLNMGTQEETRRGSNYGCGDIGFTLDSEDMLVLNALCGPAV